MATPLPRRTTGRPPGPLPTRPPHLHHDRPARLWAAMARAASGFLVVLATLLALLLQAQAQTTLFSNISQADDTNAEFTPPVAQRFTTSSNPGGYTLSSVDIKSEDSDTFSVSFCEVDGDGYPTSTCTALTAPGSYSAGTLVFNAPASSTLSASTTYTVVATPGNTTVTFDATTADGEDTGGAAGWTLANDYDFRNTSNVWGTTTSNKSLRVAIKGTINTSSVPGHPPSLVATADGLREIDLSWTTPASNGGSPIIGYRIEISPNGVFNWTTLVADTNSTSTTYSHTGLAPGTTRYYRVSAINANGTGEPSITAVATTYVTVPGAPTDLSATASGATQIDLSWTAPADDGGSPITTYGIHVSPDGRTDWRTRAGNPNTTYSQIQLAPGTTRYYRVSAANAQGLSAFSNIASATTDTTVPGPPTGLTATASGTSQINLAWMDPASNGGSASSPATRSRSPPMAPIQLDRPRHQHQRAPPPTYAHTGLASGTTRHYRVSAINTNGTGEPSNTANVTTGTSVPPGDGGGGGGGGTPPPGGGGGAGTVSNFPTADAGPDQSGVWEGALVMLDGSGSSHPDDEPLRYRWNQLSGEPVVLSSQNIVNPTFTAPQGLTADAVLSFRLLVTDPEGRFDSDTVRITVDPEAEPPPAGDRIYYFPHLAVGSGWQTTITYINYSPQEVSCQTEFLSDQGTPLMVSFADRGTVVSRPDTLPPGGSVHQETNVELSAPLAPGWARATCTGPVKASLLFRQRNSAGVPVAEAGVNATTVPATRFVTFAEQGEGQSGTGVAYANPSATAALVTFTARDADGEVLASVDETLLPNGHDAQNMVDLFDLASFSGSLEVTSTVPIVSLSLNNEADPVFSSLPPGELDADAQGTTTYYFPHLAVGVSWQTTITYINYSPQVVTCETDFISDFGSPLMVSFADQGTVVDRTDVLSPGGTVHQETNVDLSAPLAPGWARATCSGPLKASLLYRRFEGGVPTGEAGVNATTVPATRFVTFAEQGEGRFGTGVAYANPSATAAMLTFTAKDADGETLASVVRTLLPNGHDAQNMAPLFALPSFSGSLEITSTEPIVSLSLNNEAAPVFSSLPPGELDGTR